MGSRQSSFGSTAGTGTLPLRQCCGCGVEKDENNNDDDDDDVSDDYE